MQPGDVVEPAGYPEAETPICTPRARTGDGWRPSACWTTAPAAGSEHRERLLVALDPTRRPPPLAADLDGRDPRSASAACAAASRASGTRYGEHET